MSLKVIELNDSAVTVSDTDGVLVQSPGIALVGDRGLEVGNAAARQARLRPTSSFNKFWHQLSLEPLGYDIGNVRHHADLAYAHLVHLSEEAGLDGDVIFAVPGNFTSQQLAILLGLARQCSFTPVGLVDSALASTVGHVTHPEVVFADMQLHQALLTRFTLQDGHLVRESVIQIPEAGLENLNNLVMQLATGLFIQQCRFNPQHNAESEQLLYNAVPGWLARHGEDRNSLLMEIKTGGSVHQAKLPWESLLTRLGEFYARINQQIASVTRDQDTQLVISARLANLPGYAEASANRHNLIIAQPGQLANAVIRHQQHIGSSEDGFHLVTRLPLDQSPVQAQQPPAGNKSTAPQAADPTHVLFGSFALPLGKVSINNDVSAGSKGRVNGGTIELALNGLPAHLGQIEKAGDRVSITCGSAGALVNGEKVTGTRQLALGDLIQFHEHSDAIRMIRVKDGIN